MVQRLVGVCDETRENQAQAGWVLDVPSVHQTGDRGLQQLWVGVPVKEHEDADVP